MTDKDLREALVSLGYSEAEAQQATAPPRATAPNPDRLWKTKNHIYGFIDLRTTAEAAPSQPLLNAFDIAPDSTLSGRSLRFTIDRVRVKKYPGRGTHHIAFFCNARTQIGTEVTPVEYGVGYLATEGDVVPAVGITMFEGVRIVGSYVNLFCGNTNADTEKDKTFFRIIADNIFTQGLRLLDTFQPALQPLTALTRGVREEIENQHKGIPVQKWEIGLDLTAVSSRIKMREGSYVVIQIPEAEESTWKWEEWEYKGGRLQSKADPTLVIPYNYIVIGISRS